MNEHSSEFWARYYSEKDASLHKIPWEADYSLSSSERLAVSCSIAEFQKGESSEGKHLISVARKHAAAMNDPIYLDATILFIKEEQRHARDLRKYMALRDIPVARSAWPDTVFRFIRRLSGLEMSICVLVTAEIIAQSYYPALRQATNDPVLKRLCDQIIEDEEAHVAFQTERIASLRKSAFCVRRKLSELMQRFLFSGTLVVVWIQHGSVFIRAGFTFSSYWKDCWMSYRRAESCTRHPEYRAKSTGGRHSSSNDLATSP